MKRTIILYKSNKDGKLLYFTKENDWSRFKENARLMKYSEALKMKKEIKEGNIKESI